MVGCLVKFSIALLGSTLLAFGNEQNNPPMETRTSAVTTASDVSSPDFVVDTVFAFQSAIDFEGTTGVATYRFRARTWKEPLMWEISVVSGDDTLFHKTGTSIDLEEHFEEIVPHCNGYFECKKKWYLELFPRFDSSILEVGNESRTVIDDYFFENIAAIHFEQSGYIEQTSMEMAARLKQHYDGQPMLVFSFPEDPMVGGELLVYDPFVRKLVPIYEE